MLRCVSKSREWISCVLILGTGFLWVNSGLSAETDTKAKGVDKNKTALQNAGWTQKMRSMAAVLGEILVDASREDKFYSKEAAPKIQKNIAELSKLAHEVSDLKGSPDMDPSLGMFSGLFAEEAKRAEAEFKKGHKPYARTLVRALSGYCIACHSRTQSGVDFPLVGTAPLRGALATMSPLQRGEFYAASRQFDRALNEFSSVLTNPKVIEDQPIAWERALRFSLAIAVRFKQDPKLALELVESVVKAPKTPRFLKELAGEWKKSIDDWKREGVRSTPTEEGLYSESVRLFAQARELQKYPADRSADVVYLRLTAKLHELLREFPKGARVPESFLMAGLAYETLRDLNLWDLHELYYVGCIERAQHSDLGMRCYRQYEESLYFGYSGSGGTYLPPDIRKRLGDLEQKASPESDKKLQRQ